MSHYWQGNPDPAFILNIVRITRPDVKAVMEERNLIAHSGSKYDRTVHKWVNTPLSRENKLKLSELNHRLFMLTNGLYGYYWGVCWLPQAEAEMSALSNKIIDEILAEEKADAEHKRAKYPHETFRSVRHRSPQS